MPRTAAAKDAVPLADPATGMAEPDPASEPDIAALVARVETAAIEAPPPPPTVTVPRLTSIVVELLATLSSETSTAGDTFPLRLFEPVMLDGAIVIPAGTMGEGEVIHAKGKGGMGSAGELIITARFLDLYGQRVPLRSLRVNGDGQSRIDTVNTLNIASAATIPLASLIGFFVTGGATTVNEGTVGTARLAEDTDVLAPAAPTDAADTNLGALPDASQPAEPSDDADVNEKDVSE